MNAKNDKKADIEKERVDTADVGENMDGKAAQEGAAVTALKKAWDKFTTVLTFLLVAFAIYCILGTVNQNKTGELFFPFGYRTVTILSGSMENTLKTGAMVIVKETKDVEPDDIIFFADAEGFLTIHRCVGINEDGDYITKGDANPKEDYEPLTSDRLYGKVVVTMNWLSAIVRMFIQ